MANLTREIENKANGIANRVSAEAENFGSSMEKVSHNVGTKLGAVAGDVSERAADYIKTTRGYVKENPIQSVAIAAATGLVLGSLLTRVRRH